MGFLILYKHDPLIKMLQEVFGANIVRVPEERIRPLGVVAHRDGSTTYRGDLNHLIQYPLPGSCDHPLELSQADFTTSQMANVSGRRSRRVKVGLGLEILDGFLSGFGVPSAGIKTALKEANQISFSFNDVQRTYIDISLLGRRIAGKVIDRHQPATGIFFGFNSFGFLVVDSVIESREFTINVERTRCGSFNLQLPLVQQILKNYDAGVTAETTTGLDIVFRGPRHLTFAFSCVRFLIDERTGRIISIGPQRPSSLLLGVSQASENSTELRDVPMPERVMLMPRPVLLSWLKE